MKVNVSCSYSAGTGTLIELPIANWDEVKDWYVRWDILHYTLDGKKWEELELYSDTSDAIDWKRPCRVEILDEDYNETFAEMEN